MQQLKAGRKPQDHTQTYAEYCVSQLTDEYREWVEGANLDWQASNFTRHDQMGTVEGDIIATAISVIAESQHGEAFEHAVWGD